MGSQKWGQSTLTLTPFLLRGQVLQLLDERPGISRVHRALAMNCRRPFCSPDLRLKRPPRAQRIVTPSAIAHGNARGMRLLMRRVAKSRSRHFEQGTRIVLCDLQ